VVIPAGSDNYLIEIYTLPDRLVEGDETIRLVLTSATDYTLSSSYFDSMTISDNDEWWWLGGQYDEAWLTKQKDLDLWDRAFQIIAIPWDYDKEGWATTNGYSASYGDTVTASLEGDFHGWYNYPFFDVETTQHARQTLNLRFENHPITGNINIKSGSGVETTGFACSGELCVGLGYSFSIDNNYATDEHRVSVTVTATVGVYGSMSSSSSGDVGIDGKLGAVVDGLSGNFGVSFSETQSKSYTVLSDSRTYTLILKSVEISP
jgi:hypothetical protein